MNLQLTVVAIVIVTNVIVTIDIAVVDAVVGIRVGSVTDIVGASLCIGVIRQYRLPRLLQGTSLSQRVVGGRTLWMSQNGKQPYQHWIHLIPPFCFPKALLCSDQNIFRKGSDMFLPMMTSLRDVCR